MPSCINSKYRATVEIWKDYLEDLVLDKFLEKQEFDDEAYYRIVL